MKWGLLTVALIGTFSLSSKFLNDPNSASSQFFIVQKDYTSLDGSYAAFGKVFAGMDAVDFIANTETDPNDKPVKEQKIKSIRFIEVEKA